MMKLCNENKKDIALKYSNKVLGLISQSKPLPIDNSPWPFKQMTLLYYADFLSRINEYEKSYNIIKQAIDEVDSEITNKKIEKNENDIDSYWKFKTHFNQHNLSDFLSLSVHMLLKVNKIDEAKEIMAKINPNIETDAYSYGVSHEKYALFPNSSYENNVYFRSAKMIAIEIENSRAEEAIDFILSDKNISILNKFIFSQNFLKKFSYDEIIYSFKKYFIKYDLKELFLESLSFIFFIDNCSKNNEFKYISSFANKFKNDTCLAYANKSAYYNSLGYWIKEENILNNIVYKKGADYFYNEYQEIKSSKSSNFYDIIKNDVYG